MASGEPEISHHRIERSRRALVKAGCAPNALSLISGRIERLSLSDEDRARRWTELAEFARTIGPAAARDYFRAISVTGAVAELTDPAVLAFARSVDRHTAEWYFWAIWGTGAIRELTSPKVLRAVEFFQRIDSFATVEFFLAIRETREVARLTSERVLDFAERIGSEAAVEYFGAFWETKGASELTNESVLSFAETLGSDAAKEFFLAVRETRAVNDLLSEHVRAFGGRVGRRVAGEYFHAVRATKAIRELTDENVLVFAEVVGSGPAKQYFRVISSTKAVAELTDPRVLRASGVVRSIGTEAALDYFLAIAGQRGAPPAPTGDECSRTPPRDAGVPVLTLLDLPNYTGYRSLGLVGMTGLFWWYALAFSGPAFGPSRGLAWFFLAIGAWAAVLCAGYLLLRMIAGQAQDQFLDRRRRLLNEHGIRWHDCLASEQRCPLCWTSSHSHNDGRFDDRRFCRCPAC